MRTTKKKRYAGRVYLDKAIKTQVKEDLEVMVYSLLRKDQHLQIREGEFDKNPYCNCVNKKSYKYMGYLKCDDITEAGHGWMVYGNTEAEVHLEVLKMLVSREIYFPVL